MSCKHTFYRLPFTTITQDHKDEIKTIFHVWSAIDNWLHQFAVPTLKLCWLCRSCVCTAGFRMCINQAWLKFMAVCSNIQFCSRVVRPRADWIFLRLSFRWLSLRHVTKLSISHYISTLTAAGGRGGDSSFGDIQFDFYILAFKKKNTPPQEHRGGLLICASSSFSRITFF